ncbi:bacteriorhodopsin [Halobaculum sp. D14]|uniref:bacteriorhodopsin n=1 Tax=Halobaculum sp. D14 TaxID=3421642 RepID=UPI003EBCA60C
MFELTIQTWLTVGFAGMALGTLPPLWQSRADPEHRTHYAILTAITAVAAVAYLGMRFGVGTVTVSGRPLYLLRYADWFVTTLLLMGYLWLLTNAGRAALARLLVFDALVIGFGVAAVLLPTPIRFAAFAAGGVAFLALVRELVVRLPALASFRPARRRATFEKLRNVTVVLWTLYPVVWLLGPAGLGLLQPATEVLVFVYLDVVAKGGFVVMAVNGLAGLTDGGDDRESATDDAEPVTAD